MSGHSSPVPPRDQQPVQRLPTVTMMQQTQHRGIQAGGAPSGGHDDKYNSFETAPPQALLQEEAHEAMRAEQADADSAAGTARHADGSVAEGFGYGADGEGGEMADAPDATDGKAGGKEAGKPVTDAPDGSKEVPRRD